MDSDTDTDIIIGLDVRGQVFYCNKSELLNVNNGSSYFSARFREDSMLDAGLDRVDDEGRDIYVLDRDPSIFRHIMEYIDTNEKPIGIGVHENNKKLWRLVREEALYFGLDHLIKLMRITFICSPEVDGDRGIMYWLGTKKGISDYVNPYSIGAVDISLWSDEGKDDDVYIDKKSKALMVQYRPNPEGDNMSILCDGYDEFDDIFSNAFGAISDLMGCDASAAGGGTKNSIGFHLLNGVVVSPTHYSIRSGGCYGMAGDWNLEASVDGRTWDVIHESRGRQPKVYNGVREAKRSELWETVKSCNRVDRIDAVCDYMEENHRHTWRVDNSSDKFYSYFRFISIEIPEGEVDERADEEDEVNYYRNACLHGIGFEVYGSVHEDWKYEQQQEETPQDRIQRLEDENMALLNENDSLKARIRQLENKRSAEEACLPEN